MHRNLGRQYDFVFRLVDCRHRFGLEQALRRRLEVPDKTQLFQSKQNVIGDIDLPPEKALAA